MMKIAEKCLFSWCGLTAGQCWSSAGFRWQPGAVERNRAKGRAIKNYQKWLPKGVLTPLGPSRPANFVRALITARLTSKMPQKAN